jgi:hypothetical protein
MLSVWRSYDRRCTLAVLSRARVANAPNPTVRKSTATVSTEANPAGSTAAARTVKTDIRTNPPPPDFIIY